MKFSGIAGTVLLAFAAMFKINHLAGAGIMLSLGGLTLAFVFIPAALVVLWKETHSGKKLFLYISAFITAMLFIAGVTARVQHWPMASLFLTAGSAIIFFAVFPSYTWLTWRKEGNVTAKFIFMVTGMIVLMLPVLMLNLSLQRTFESGYYIHHEEQQALFDYRFRSNQSVINRCNDSSALPILKELNNRTSELISVINNTEAKLIAETEGKPRVPAVLTNQIAVTETGPAVQFNTLSHPFQTVPFSNFLMKDSGLRNEIAAAMKKYSDYLSGQLPSDKFEMYVKLLEPSVYLPEINSETDRVPLITGLHMLELMKNGILTAESYAIAMILEVNNR